MFDVLAIRGENAGRLIPKSLEDKLARYFFSLGKKYLWREEPRACARANKAFIQPEVRRIDVNFFSLNHPHADCLLTFQQHLNLLKN